MRIAIISDIHSNIEALHAVMRALDASSIDRLVCLGDVIGYGASPNACCDALRKSAAVTLLGNHDAAVTDRMDYSFYYEAARHALKWSAEVLSPENLAWLNSLPYTHHMRQVGFCHGAPPDPRAYEYIFTAEQVYELTSCINELPAINFIGHSHLCKAFAAGDGIVHDVSARKLQVEEQFTYIISVGSVGQPRDCNNRACLVIYDDEACTVEYARIEYDIASSAKKIFDANLSASFGKRLFLGM